MRPNIIITINIEDKIKIIIIMIIGIQNNNYIRFIITNY